MKRVPAGLGLIRYEYHLSAKSPLTGDTRIDRPLDPHPWFDIHDHLEFGMVLKGGVRRHWGSVHRDLTPGDIWLCAAFEPHGYQITRAPCDLVFLIFWPGLLRNIRLPGTTAMNWLAPFQVPPAERATVTPAQRNDLLALGHRLAKTVKATDTFSRKLLHLLLMEILLAVMDSTSVEAWPKDNSSLGTPLLKAVERVMQSHRMITTEEMASSVKMSVDQFSRRFEREVGSSFAKFGLRCRLNGVAHDLSTTDHPIKAIAAEWDFADESHLHRVFLRHFAFSPGTYRRQRHVIPKSATA